MLDDRTDDLVVWDEFEKSNTPGSSTHRVVERRGKAKRRRARGWEVSPKATDSIRREGQDTCYG